MPRQLTVPKYWKYSDLDPGTKLVSKGEFIGVTEGRYGNQYNFIEIDGGQHVVLNKAGQFEWRIDQGHMVEGQVFDVVFQGTEKLTRGQYAGKDVNKFDILCYEDPELPEKYRRGSGSVVAKAQPTPEQAAQAEALDDLA